MKYLLLYIAVLLSSCCPNIDKREKAQNKPNMRKILPHNSGGVFSDKYMDSILELNKNLPYHFDKASLQYDSLSFNYYLENVKLTKKLFSLANEKLLKNIEVDEIYRLINVKSFLKGFVFISISRNYKNDDIFISRKIISTAPNEDCEIYKYPRHGDTVLFHLNLIDSLTRKISLKEWRKVKSLINGSYFWSLKHGDSHSSSGMDPEVFILDGIEDNDYHHIRRGNAQGTLRDLCLKLYELAGIEYDRYKIKLPNSRKSDK